MAAQDKVLIALLALLAAAALAATVPPRVAVDPRLGVTLQLPDRIGVYRGSLRLYCQNTACDGRFRSVENRAERVCSQCGAALDPVSLAERNSLPADTIISKRSYADGGRVFAVTIVASGLEQKSIHRPEQCLPAQGYAIENRRVWRVADGGGRPFRVMRLGLRPAAPDRAERASSSFVYWFIGPDRETPYHAVRLFWTSVDRAWRGVSPRWAYVAVFANTQGGSESDREAFAGFLSSLHAELVSGQESR